VSISFYFDEHVPFPIVQALRRSRVDVLLARDDGHDNTPDPVVLNRATELGRVVFTQDTDFLREAHARINRGSEFAGVIFAPQMAHMNARYARDLELIALAGEPNDFRSRVEYLPFR
jgi:hypothetical protein